MSAGSSLKQLLEAELKTLERELKIEIPQAIKTAVAMGDLRENAEYHAALERQRFLQARTGQLKQRLADLSLVRFDQVAKDSIGLGSLFTVVDAEDGKEIRYEIVMDGMADPVKGMISVTSPLARGFLNKKVGDDVTINVPSGKRSYEITDLKTAHERE